MEEDEDEEETKKDEKNNDNKDKLKDKKTPKFLKGGTLVILPTIAITQWAAEIKR
jgi:hypothetical protein